MAIRSCNYDYNKPIFFERLRHNYTWIVEGPIIKDFDNSIFNATTNLTAPHNIEEPTPMSPSDFHKSDIQFYWQPNATDTNRTVTVFVQGPDESCRDSRDYLVSKGNDSDHQAEDFYVETNQFFGGREVPSRVLLEHAKWHSENSPRKIGYNGTAFLYFHNHFLNHFDSWRKLFGYENISQWDPGTNISKEVDIQHANRLVAKILTNQYHCPLILRSNQMKQLLVI